MPNAGHQNAGHQGPVSHRAERHSNSSIGSAATLILPGRSSRRLAPRREHQQPSQVSSRVALGYRISSSVPPPACPARIEALSSPPKANQAASGIRWVVRQPPLFKRWCVRERGRGVVGTGERRGQQRGFARFESRLLSHAAIPHWWDSCRWHFPSRMRAACDPHSSDQSSGCCSLA